MSKLLWRPEWCKQHQLFRDRLQHTSQILLSRQRLWNWWTLRRWQSLWLSIQLCWWDKLDLWQLFMSYHMWCGGLWLWWLRIVYLSKSFQQPDLRHSGGQGRRWYMWLPRNLRRWGKFPRTTTGLWQLHMSYCMWSEPWSGWDLCFRTNLILFSSIRLWEWLFDSWWATWILWKFFEWRSLRLSWKLRRWIWHWLDLRNLQLPNHLPFGKKWRCLRRALLSMSWQRLQSSDTCNERQCM